MVTATLALRKWGSLERHFLDGVAAKVGVTPVAPLNHTSAPRSIVAALGIIAAFDVSWVSF